MTKSTEDRAVTFLVELVLTTLAVVIVGLLSLPVLFTVGHSATKRWLDIGDCARLVGNYPDRDGRPTKETALFLDRSTLILWRSYSDQELNRRAIEVPDGTQVEVIDSYERDDIKTRQVRILDGKFKGRTGWTIRLKDLAPARC